VDTPLRTRALLASGQEQGHDQAVGKRMLSPEEVAKSTLVGAWSRRRLVVLGWETRLARIFGAMFPAALDAILSRQAR
jgi:short-subunit dehydrogenase